MNRLWHAMAAGSVVGLVASGSPTSELLLLQRFSADMSRARCDGGGQGLDNPIFTSEVRGLG
jgi:hypothetical protein